MHCFLNSRDHCLSGVFSGLLGHAKQLATFAASYLGLVRVPLAGRGRPGEETAPKDNLGVPFFLG